MAEALSDDREGPQLVNTRMLALALDELRVTPLETIDGTLVVDIKPVLRAEVSARGKKAVRSVLDPATFPYVPRLGLG